METVCKAFDGEVFYTLEECMMHEMIAYARAIKSACDYISCSDCVLFDKDSGKCKLTGCSDSSDLDHQPCTWDI